MKRIQRKRTKGWRMPDNSIYVGRPTMWGNPFKVVGDTIYVFSRYRFTHNLDPWIFHLMGDTEKAAEIYHECVLNNSMVYAYCADMRDIDIVYIYDHFKQISQNLNKLKGKDLVCWCSLDKPCHADVIIKIINKQP